MPIGYGYDGGNDDLKTRSHRGGMGVVVTIGVIQDSVLRQDGACARIRRALLGGTALIAPIALGLFLVAPPALADCVQTGNSVNCAPPGTGGFVAAGDGLAVVVQPGTTVIDDGTQAIAVNNT